jgi:hypothetical protein
MLEIYEIASSRNKFGTRKDILGTYNTVPGIEGSLWNPALLAEFIHDTNQGEKPKQGDDGT